MDSIFNLFINGAEALRYDKENEAYYISSEDNMCLVKTDKQTFMKELAKYSWIKNSWDKETKDDYENLFITVGGI